MVRFRGSLVFIKIFYGILSVCYLPICPQYRPNEKTNSTVTHYTLRSKWRSNALRARKSIDVTKSLFECTFLIIPPLGALRPLENRKKRTKPQLPCSVPRCTLCFSESDSLHLRDISAKQAFPLSYVCRRK